MATPITVTVVYRESGSGCVEAPVRSGTGVSREDSAYNAFQFSLVSPSRSWNRKLYLLRDVVLCCEKKTD